MTTSAIFLEEIHSLFKMAKDENQPYVDINSGDVHRAVGGYPGTNHRMPVCCDTMYDAMREGDSILSAPPKGKGASLNIRYKLPR